MKIIKNIKEKYVEIKLNDPRYFDSNCIVEEKRNEQYGWGKYHNSNLKIKLLSTYNFEGLTPSDNIKILYGRKQKWDSLSWHFAKNGHIPSVNIQGLYNGCYADVVMEQFLFYKLLTEIGAVNELKIFNDSENLEEIKKSAKNIKIETI